MTHRLAEIGVTGFQLDVADGGDVDPQTGRLLTIAEMQHALRMVRQTPLLSDRAVRGDGVGTEPAQAGTFAISAGLVDSSDPYDWEPLPVDDTAESVTGGQRRDDHETTDDDLQVRPARRRARRKPLRLRRRGSSGATRLARRVLGVDRSPRTRESGDDVDWLPQLTSDDPDLTLADDTAAAGAKVPRRRRSGRGAAASAAVAAGAVVGDDFEVAGAPRGFTAVFWRWVARILLLVLVLAGINQLFVRPFRATTTDAPATTGVDAIAASQLAARFTADYLSYVSTVPAGNTEALTAQLVTAASVSRLVFSGAGYVRADLVQPGQVKQVDATHAVVAVTARLRVATPPDGAGQPGGAAAQAAPAAAADPGPVPAGWTDLGSRWIAVMVPVEVTAAGLRVSPAGPVFSAEPPGIVAPPETAAGIDADTVSATRDVATAFFAGYAASNVSYLSAPGITMGGLGGAVTLASVDNWSMAVPVSSGNGPADALSGVGSGSVTWQLSGTALTLTQQYAVGMTHADGRWYAAALSPTPATGS